MEKNNEIKNYCVYKHTSPIGKVYIGITGQKPEKRWQNGYGYKEQILFWRAIKKYGWDNFRHEILYDNLTRNEACELEIQEINKYNSTNQNYGYNISLGGDLTNSKPVNMYSIDCTFIKRFDTISEASCETGISNNAISNAATGCAMTAGNYIWRYDGETLDKYPIRKYSNFELYNLINTCKVKQYDFDGELINTCKVKQYDFDGELINTYKDLKEAAKATNAQEHYIFMVCNGEQNSHRGYVWRFENDNFDKYFNKFRIRIGEDEVHLINYNDLKYSNIKIYQYNFDGSLNSIYEDVYSIPHIPDNEVWRVIACAKRKQDTHKGYIYRFEKDEILEKNGYCRNTKDTVKIKQYDMNGNYLQTYNSLSIAKEKTGATNIGECAKGRRHHSGGYVWRYENDEFDKFSIERNLPKIELKYNKPIYQFDFGANLVKKYESLYEFPIKERGNIVQCLDNKISHVKGCIYSYDEKLNYDKLKNIKRIAQYTLDGKLIKVYNSIKEAKAESGATKISDCLNHYTKSSGGYKWKYILHSKEEENESN